MWSPPPGIAGVLSTVDHKTIGKRYLATAFAFLLIGGALALVMRAQLARPDQRLLTKEVYDQVFTMHGVTMIFWYASPILSGFSNYLVPLMIGARDTAYPRLNAFTYWTFLLSGIFLYGSVALGQSPHAGWFAYAPYNSEKFSPGFGMDFYALALIFLTISTTAGAINLLVTILRMRAPGMTLNRMPLFMYSTATTQAVILFSLPALTAACLFLELDRRWHFHFFDVANGGSTLMWQQLFWFFGHPWVYVVFLPATGMISMILPVFARRPIVGYPYIATATVLTGLVGFGVWVHHMFSVGMNHAAMTYFSAASMTISLFTTVQVFAWIATLWKGRVVMRTPMLFALGFLASIVIGGLSGVVTAIIPFDWQVTDTYFVVAHLHYVLVGANLLPVLAGLFYWFPKMTGRLYDERLGILGFVLVFGGLNIAFFPMHLSGILGMRRRIATFEAGHGLDGLNMISSIGAAVLALGVLVCVWSLAKGKVVGLLAGKNPWNADTLEWDTDSPPEDFGTEHIPTIETRHPLWDEHDEEEDPKGERILDQQRFTLTTTWLDAVPKSIMKMPEDTVTPLLAALSLVVLFVAALAKSYSLLAVGAGATLAVTAAWLWPEEEKSYAHPPTQDDGAMIVHGLDDKRGLRAMQLFVLTEAVLFVMLFFAYFYLGPYPTEKPPELRFPIPMLVILLASSAVLHVGERAIKKERDGRARAAVAGTIALAIAFFVLQVLEYKHHLQELTPQTNAYGSIFYTITSLHAAHLVLGTLMLAYVFVLPWRDRAGKSPHRALASAAFYWHFVDFVWVLIVGILYVLPNVSRW